MFHRLKQLQIKLIVNLLRPNSSKNQYLVWSPVWPLNSLFPCLPISQHEFTEYFITRTTQAHDVSRHAAQVRMCALRMRVGHVEQMSEISQSPRTTTVESNTKSEHNLYLACEDSPQRAFFFCTFSCSRLALLVFTVYWLGCFSFLNAANRRLCSVLDSAKRVRCGGPTALSYPSFIALPYPLPRGGRTWRHVVATICMHALIKFLVQESWMQVTWMALWTKSRWALSVFY